MTTPTQKKVTEDSLCTRCGCCFSVCPQGCITLDRYPIIEEGCTSCGICTDICPGKRLANLKKDRLFTNAHFHEYVGWYRNAYTGYSTSTRIREKATSGGVVTSLLVCLLEKGIIDGALVVSLDDKEPWKTHYLLATSPEEIIKCAQTKYQITPLTVQLTSTTLNKIAVVGLPCAIQGLRKAQEYSWVKEKLYLLIGLFCWVNMEREATEFLLEKLRIHKNDVQSIEYRSGDYLGGFKVQVKNGEVTVLGKEYYNILPLLFAAERCLYCPDFTSELADISVGDAKFVQSEKGHTYVMTRSERGEKILTLCQSHIHLEPSTIEDIIQSERSALFFKKGAYKRMHEKEPYKIRIPFKNQLFELIFMGVYRNRRFFQLLVKIMPLSFFKLISKMITKERS